MDIHPGLRAFVAPYPRNPSSLSCYRRHCRRCHRCWPSWAWSQPSRHLAGWETASDLNHPSHPLHWHLSLIPPLSCAALYQRRTGPFSAWSLSGPQSSPSRKLSFEAQELGRPPYHFAVILPLPSVLAHLSGPLVGVSLSAG